jgi:mannosyltransferase OCH1-like enzyme
MAASFPPLMQPSSAHRPIVQYWHSEQLPADVAEHVKTYETHNPDLRHLVFNERSAASFIECHLGARYLRAFQACAIPAMQADYFRYCAILVMGGIYSDVDQRCVRSLRPFIPAAGHGWLYRTPHGFVNNSAFAFGSAEHPFLDLVIDITTVNIENAQSARGRSFTGRAIFFITGPAIFTALIRLHRLGSFDRFLARAKNHDAEFFLRSYCQTIGDYSRVRQALDGLEVHALEQDGAPIAGAGYRLSYKKSRPWGSVSGNLFRSVDAE